MLDVKEQYAEKEEYELEECTNNLKQNNIDENHITSKNGNFNDTLSNEKVARDDDKCKLQKQLVIDAGAGINGEVKEVTSFDSNEFLSTPAMDEPISSNVRDIVRRLSSEEPNNLAEIEKQCVHEPSKENYKEWYKVIFSLTCSKNAEKINILSN